MSTFGRKPLLVKNPRGREVIVTGSHDGGIYVFGEDGTLIRRIETHSPVGSPVVLTPQGHLVAGLDNGMVVTFSLDGEKVGEFRTQGAKQGVGEWVVTFEDGEKVTFDTGRQRRSGLSRRRHHGGGFEGWKGVLCGPGNGGGKGLLPNPGDYFRPLPW